MTLAQRGVHNDIRRQQDQQNGTAAWLHGLAMGCSSHQRLRRAVSAVLKFCDARVYAHAISMIIVLVVAVPLFGQTLSAQVLALFLVLGSTVQYNVPKTFAGNMCVWRTRLCTWHNLAVARST